MQRFTFLIATFLVLALSGIAITADARAQDTTEASVHVNLCIAAGCTELPEAIEPVDGVEVSISSYEDGTFLGACVTGERNPGTCIIPLEVVPEMVTVTVNPATVPAGYVADTSGAPYGLVPETPEIRILLYPEDGVLDPPPAQDAPEEPEMPPVDDGQTGEPGAPVPLPLPILASYPASFYAGTCADLDAATSAEPLTDLVLIDGDHMGSPDALVAATSYSVVPVSMTDITGGQYAIAVMDEGQQVIACGDIGGPPAQNGALSVGLAPVDDSGAAGTAYVAPLDGGQVAVSAFLVPEGLVPAVVTGAEPDRGVELDEDPPMEIYPVEPTPVS